MPWRGRLLGGVGVAALLVEPAHPVGLDAPRQQAVDADPAGAELVGEGLGDHRQPRPEAVGDGQPGDRATSPRTRARRRSSRRRSSSRPISRPEPQPAEEHRLDRGRPVLVGGVHQRPGGGSADGDQRPVEPAVRRPGGRRPARAACRGRRCRPPPRSRCRRRARRPPRRRVSACRPEITTLAPSATSASAVARPRPPDPPVTTYTCPCSPRSMRHPGQTRSGGADRELGLVEVGVEPALGQQRGVACRTARPGRRRRRGSGRRCGPWRAGAR